MHNSPITNSIFKSCGKNNYSKKDIFVMLLQVGNDCNYLWYLKNNIAKFFSKYMNFVSEVLYSLSLIKTEIQILLLIDITI